MNKRRRLDTSRRAIRERELEDIGSKKYMARNKREKNKEGKRDRWVMTKELRHMDYKEYLRTDHWRHTRERKLQEAHRMCQTCGSQRKLQVHHLTYKRRGCEQMSDLEVLCASCHSTKHNT